MKFTFGIAALTSTMVSAIQIEATKNDNNGDAAIFVPTTDESTFLKFSGTGEFETFQYTVHTEMKDWNDAFSVCQS